MGRNRRSGPKNGDVTPFVACTPQCHVDGVCGDLTTSSSTAIGDGRARHFRSRDSPRFDVVRSTSRVTRTPSGRRSRSRVRTFVGGIVAIVIRRCSTSSLRRLRRLVVGLEHEKTTSLRRRPWVDDEHRRSTNSRAADRRSWTRETRSPRRGECVEQPSNNVELRPRQNAANDRRRSLSTTSSHRTPSSVMTLGCTSDKRCHVPISRA